MAASLKVSELNALTSVAATDLILISDVDASASKKTTLTQFEGSLSLANLGTRELANLSNVASTAPSTNQVLAWNGSAWAPADAATQASLSVDHLITLSGVSEGSDDLGTFTGSTIADNSDIKTALQALETAAENAEAGSVKVQAVASSTNANHYITFVDSNNVSAADESIYTDAGIYYNPFLNQFNANGVNTGVLSINSVDVTSTAAELNILDGVTASTSEINKLDGVTASTSEINKLDGVTATTTELNYTDGVTSNIQTQLDAKQATISGGDGIDVTSNSVSVDLATAITASEQLVLSGMTDSDHNDTYNMVYRSGTRLKATFDQSGTSIKISTQREAPYYIDISGTELAAANGETLTVIKHTGYITRSGTTYTWNIGSTGSNFYWYYWNTTSQIFAAYNATDTEWTVFDLDEATGNASSFIGDLDSTGSNPGYLSSGENFTLADSHKDTLSNSSTNYPDEIVYVPSDSGHVAYQAASDHPYYVYQNSAANKWIIFARDPSFYWTALHRSSAFDLTTETLTDDAVAFSLDSTSDFEFITTSSDSYAGANIPDAAASEVTYSSGSSDSYLEFSSNKLAVKVKDEDDLSSDSADHVPTQQSVKAYVDANETHIDNIMTLLGETKDDTNLSTFTGSTISDNGTVRAALQELETAVDNALGGGAAAASVGTVTRSTDATHYLTFVTDDNASTTQENIYTDAGVSYNPSTNLLTAGNITVSGNLTVDGTTTTINSTTVTVDDKNIELGSVDTPTDTTADGGGITLKGATDKTFNWVNATDSWTSSEHVDLASGKAYYIDNASVLNSTTLGSTVVNSSLTSVGTLSALTVSGTTNLTGTFQLGGTSVTSTAAELNILDGVTATAAEINLLDGVTATTAEINLLDGVTATTTELNYTDGVTSNIQTQFNTINSTVTEIDANADDLITLSGVAENATNLGTFTGTTIADNETVKGALQDLETALEGPLPVLVEVHNDTGSAITKGQVVYVSGTHTNGKPTIALADSDASGKTPAIGLVHADIADGADGNVVTAGLVSGLDTSSLSAGDALYVHTTAGSYTSTRPTAAGTEVQKVAIVSRSHASSGSLLVIGAGRANDVPNELTALTGVSLDAQNLGTFSGTIIADNETIKGAIQDLEDELGNITLTNLNINGGSSITIADADKIPFYDASGSTNGVTTATLVADYVASKKTVKQLANVGTTADSEPTNYYFLAVDASNGNIVILNKEFVETEGSP